MNGLHLSFGSPIDDERAKALVRDLTAIQPRHILDLGCGWGELLLRSLESTKGSQGTGIDLEEAHITRARKQAQLRGLEPRVTFSVGDASAHAATSDAVINMGAWHALGSTPEQSLVYMRGLVPRGGRLLFGVDYWARVPGAEVLAQMWDGATVGDSNFLPDVVEAAANSGWRLLGLHEASANEWNHFECGLHRNQELWLLDNPEHPEAESLRNRIDSARMSWLRGHYGYMGFATLVLAAS